MSMTDTKQDIAPKRENPVAVVRNQLDAMQDQFGAALPDHIPVARFVRVVMTAVQNNPELLECDRRSLFNAAMKAAQDGCIPDGREGAIVVRFDPKVASKKAANWQIMIAGIRKKARNSGEIATWDVEEVHENDAFEFELGDNPYIHHKPALSNRGKLIACYSVCTLKSGEKTRCVMGIDDILAIRDQYSDGWKAYKAGRIKSTPWLTSEGEMSKKTVARRHGKTIPMSTDLEAVLRRDDEPLQQVERTDTPRDRPKSLTGRLDALAGIPTNDAAPETIDPDTGEITPSSPPASGEAAAGETRTTSLDNGAEPGNHDPETNSAPGQQHDRPPTPTPTAKEGEGGVSPRQGPQEGAGGGSLHGSSSAPTDLEMGADEARKARAAEIKAEARARAEAGTGALQHYWEGLPRDDAMLVSNPAKAELNEVARRADKAAGRK